VALHRRPFAGWPGYLWAAPVSIPGLLLALAARYRGATDVVDGVVEAHGPLLAWGLRRLVPLDGGAAAITLGHVVLARSQDALEMTRAHERVHVRQYERWGLFLVPAYLGASVWALLRRRHPYFDNPFEREAFRAEQAMPAVAQPGRASSLSDSAASWIRASSR
jgi:hypothetical protein